VISSLRSTQWIFRRIYTIATFIINRASPTVEMNEDISGMFAQKYKQSRSRDYYDTFRWKSWLACETAFDKPNL